MHPHITMHLWTRFNIISSGVHVEQKIPFVHAVTVAYTALFIPFFEGYMHLHGGDLNVEFWHQYFYSPPQRLFVIFAILVTWSWEISGIFIILPRIFKGKRRKASYKLKPHERVTNLKPIRCWAVSISRNSFTEWAFIPSTFCNFSSKCLSLTLCRCSSEAT